MQCDDVGMIESFHHLYLNAFLVYFMHRFWIIDRHLLCDEVVIAFIFNDWGHFWFEVIVLWLLRPIVSMIMYFFSNMRWNVFVIIDLIWINSSSNKYGKFIIWKNIQSIATHFLSRLRVCLSDDESCLYSVYINNRWIDCWEEADHYWSSTISKTTRSPSLKVPNLQISANQCSSKVHLPGGIPSDQHAWFRHEIPRPQALRRLEDDLLRRGG